MAGTWVLDYITSELKCTGLATSQPYCHRQVMNFFERLFFLSVKIEMTIVPISEDFKREHYKALNTDHGTREALNKQHLLIITIIYNYNILCWGWLFKF